MKLEDIDGRADIYCLRQNCDETGELLKSAYLRVFITQPIAKHMAIEEHSILKQF